jgi:regulator of CtrA degradation
MAEEAITGSIGDDSRGRIIAFADSELFERAFAEGMQLVEETAAYLDGPGRQESKLLPKAIALAYAGESMRLTTRLMQAASWLLVHRAVREREMNPSEAAQEKYRIASRTLCEGDPFEGLTDLPARLQDLLLRSQRLYQRVRRFDDQIYSEQESPENAVQTQQDRLREAFTAPAFGRRIDDI